MEQSSQLIQSNKISKPLSKDDSERLAQGSIPTHIKHKEGYVEETKKTINKAGLNGQLIQSKDTTPRPTKEEINRLAKAWCELVLGQVMEEQNQQKLIGANSGKTAENIYRGRKQKRTRPLEETESFSTADCST